MDATAAPGSARVNLWRVFGNNQYISTIMQTSAATDTLARSTKEMVLEAKDYINLCAEFPAGTILCILDIGVVIYWIVVAALRQTVIAPAWPFCHECEQARNRLRRVA